MGKGNKAKRPNSNFRVHDSLVSCKTPIIVQIVKNNRIKKQDHAKLNYELLEINASKKVIRLSDIQQKTHMLITNNCRKQI